jgi:sporulation protein YlmC with PRC-barrel domain
MIRTLLATTALAALLATGTIAQDAAPADPAAPAAEAPADPAAPAAEPAAPADSAAPAAPAATDPAAGADVESGAMEETDVREPWDMSAGYVATDTDNLASRLIDQPVYSSAGDDAEEIGNITDLVFSEDGQITAVIIGVGGFLGIGEKAVAVDFQSLEFTLAADNTERWVLPTTADALTAAPDFVWEEDEPADVTTDPAAPADPMAPAADPAAPAADPAAPAADPAAPATN